MKLFTRHPRVTSTRFDVRIAERLDILIAVRIIKGSFKGSSDNRSPDGSAVYYFWVTYIM